MQEAGLPVGRLGDCKRQGCQLEDWEVPDCEVMAGFGGDGLIREEEASGEGIMTWLGNIVEGLASIGLQP